MTRDEIQRARRAASQCATLLDAGRLDRALAERDPDARDPAVEVLRLELALAWNAPLHLALERLGRTDRSAPPSVALADTVAWPAFHDAAAAVAASARPLSQGAPPVAQALARVEAILAPEAIPDDLGMVRAGLALTASETDTVRRALVRRLLLLTLVAAREAALRALLKAVHVGRATPAYRAEIAAQSRAHAEAGVEYVIEMLAGERTAPPSDAEWAHRIVVTRLTTDIATRASDGNGNSGPAPDSSSDPE